jgi:hypothetical protein
VGLKLADNVSHLAAAISRALVEPVAAAAPGLEQGG